MIDIKMYDVPGGTNGLYLLLTTLSGNDVKMLFFSSDGERHFHTVCFEKSLYGMSTLYLKCINQDCQFL